MSQGQDRFCKLPSGLTLCYRTYGPDNGIPLVLVVGLGLQLIYWSPRLIGALVARGFRVITLDNRDSGRSDRIDAAPPSLMDQWLRRPGEGYDLGDMALDAVGVLDALDIPAAHWVGMSMGGMIAQVAASRQSDRVLSLTSIFSTTGAPRVGQPHPLAMLRLVRPPARSREENIARYVSLTRYVGPSTYDLPDTELRDYASQAWERGQGLRDAAAVARQIGAIMRTGDRTVELGGVRAPTLVLHGHHDPLVHPSGGVATAHAIPNARLLTLYGMGHYLPEGVLPVLADLVGGHALRVGAGT